MKENFEERTKQPSYDEMIDEMLGRPPKRMTIDQFVDKFEIEPIRDIDPFFELEREFYFDMSGYDRGKCLNCGEPLNNQWLKSAAWSAVQRCIMCDRLNVVYYADHMGGNSLSTIRVFKERPPLSFEDTIVAIPAFGKKPEK